MEQQTPLQALIARCRRSPDFAELDFSDINQPCNDGDALIHLVAWQGGLDELDLLMSAGAAINASGDLGHTPLHYAAMKGHFKTAQKLLDLGANPSIKNDWDETAEIVAFNGGHMDVAKLLRHNKYRNMKRNK